MRNLDTDCTAVTPGQNASLRPNRDGWSTRTIGNPPRGSGDAFEWREGARMPPPPKYDSHRLDDDGARRFGFSNGGLR